MRSLYTMLLVGSLAGLALSANVASAQSTSEALQQYIDNQREKLGCRSYEDLVTCQSRVSQEQIWQAYHDGQARRAAASAGGDGEASATGPVYYDAQSLETWGGASSTRALFCAGHSDDRAECAKWGHGCVAVPRATVEAANRRLQRGSALPGC